MGKEKILLVGDSIQGPTGFACDGMGISWCLAKDFDVHYLGLQSVHDEKVKIMIEEESREVIQHANVPRGRDKWDFGKKSLPVLLDRLEPEILLTINDIQMVQHVPNVMCPNSINLQVLDLPSKTYIGEEAMRMQLQGQLQRFRERFPRETKWIQYAPQDGEPPMSQWSQIYKMADQCVAMSDYGKNIFKRYFDMNIPRIWHGVDTSIFNDREKPSNLQDKFMVGNFNRNQPRKFPVRAMRAFAKFAKDKPDVFLHMQMDFQDQFGWPLMYFAQLFGIQNKLVQPKPVGMSRQEVANTYNMWDVQINATGGEGFGLTTTESGACGVPNIITDYTTSRELIVYGSPSPRGMLAKVLDLHWERLDIAAVQRSLVDVDHMAECLDEYYKNPDILKEHGKNAEVWTRKNCSWKVIAPQWIDLIGNVLSGDNESD